MEYNSYVTLFVINIVIYLGGFFLILRRDNYSAIAIRSPKLTIISALASFIITSSFITYEMVEDYDNVEDYNFSFCILIPFVNILFHFVIFFTLIMRIHRIVQTYQVNNMIIATNKDKAKNFYSKHFLLEEKFYLKLLCGVILLCFLCNIVIYISSSGNVPYPYHFFKCPCNNNENKRYMTYMFFNFVYFFESFILLYYCYKFYFSNFKNTVKIEFISQILLSIIYFHCVKYSFSNNEEPFHKSSVFVLLFNYAFVFLNNVVPFGLSMVDKIKLSYHFNPKLSSNLYLFLSDEISYYSFRNYMRNNPRDNFYISLYTQITKYKYKYTLEFNYYKVYLDAKELYENYFGPKANNTYMSEELLQKVRNSCQKLNEQVECSYEQFDDALVNIYEVLEKRFKEYRKTSEYTILVDNLNLNSYVQYKMCVSHDGQTNSGF